MFLLLLSFKNSKKIKQIPFTHFCVSPSRDWCFDALTCFVNPHILNFSLWKMHKHSYIHTSPSCNILRYKHSEVVSISKLIALFISLATNYTTHNSTKNMRNCVTCNSATFYWLNLKNYRSILGLLVSPIIGMAKSQNKSQKLHSNLPFICIPYP